MEIKQIYQNIDNIILTHLMINDDAMKHMQALGYNGFKRLHRCDAKYFMCKHQELLTCYYDKYQMVLDVFVEGTTYKPFDLKEHLEKWHDVLMRDIKQLGELNQEHFDTIGVTSCIIEELICCLNKRLTKVNRWIHRFNESSWNSIDCHSVDDRLHEKMKEKEERK